MLHAFQGEKVEEKGIRRKWFKKDIIEVRMMDVEGKVSAKIVKSKIYERS